MVSVALSFEEFKFEQMAAMRAMLDILRSGSLNFHVAQTLNVSGQSNIWL